MAHTIMGFCCHSFLFSNYRYFDVYITELAMLIFAYQFTTDKDFRFIHASNSLSRYGTMLVP